MRDKLSYMIAERRESNKKNERNSGNLEEVGPLDQLLDDSITDVDNTKVALRSERDETTDREESLLAAGEQIQQTALS